MTHPATTSHLWYWLATGILIAVFALVVLKVVWMACKVEQEAERILREKQRQHEAAAKMKRKK